MRAFAARKMQPGSLCCVMISKWGAVRQFSGSYQVEVTEGVVQFQGKDILFERYKIQGKLGDIHIANDSCIFQDLIAYKCSSWYPKYGKFMLNIAVLL
jgi:hypothetical protein